MSETVQVVAAGVLAAAAAGCGYVTFNTKDVTRAILWFLAAAALLVVAVVVLGGGAREGAFVFIAAVTLVAAMAAVRAPQLMHATLFLTAALLGVAGVFLTAGAEFLALIQVLVYVGAVITLILFTIMLTTPAEAEADLRSIELPAGVHVESVRDIDSALPGFTGVGPYKTLRDTNPRKPTRIPATLEGVALTDEELGSGHEPAPRPQEESA